jgi:hypothetical protein
MSTRSKFRCGRYSFQTKAHTQQIMRITLVASSSLLVLLNVAPSRSTGARGLGLVPGWRLVC